LKETQFAAVKLPKYPWAGPTRKGKAPGNRVLKWESSKMVGFGGKSFD